MRSILKNFGGIINDGSMRFKSQNCIGYDVTDEKKPFYLLNNVFVVIETYKDIIRLAIPKGYKWDGCTIKGKFLQLFSVVRILRNMLFQVCCMTTY